MLTGFISDSHMLRVASCLAPYPHNASRIHSITSPLCRVRIEGTLLLGLRTRPLPVTRAQLGWLFVAEQVFHSSLFGLWPEKRKHD